MLKVFCLLLCVLLKETYGAQAIIESVSKPPDLADQEGCYDPVLKIVLGYEKSFNTSDCAKHTCEKNGNIMILTCGAIGVSEGEVRVKGNLSLPYPLCCDTVEPKPTDPCHHDSEQLKNV